MLADTVATIDCNNRPHRLAWRAGRLVPLDHDDPEREAALTALGGEVHRCIALLHAWNEHAADLDVLLLAARGPGDRIPPADGEDFPQHRHPMHHPGRGSGWIAHSQTQDDGWSAAHPVTLEQLLQLPAGLPQRLVEKVVTTWTERWQDDDVGTARPRLHAALYGRLAAAMRSWFGEPEVRIDLQVVADDEPSSIRRDDAGVHAAVPFTWLLDTWVPGHAVVLDRFCLRTTTPEPGRSELTTLGRDFGEQRLVTITG